MSSSAIDLTQYAPDVITQKLIFALKGVAAAINKTNVYNYDLAAKQYTVDVDQVHALNIGRQQSGQTPLPLPVAPPIPDILIVDESYVALGEQTPIPANYDSSKVFARQPYFPLQPPPPPPPQIVIGDAIPGLPGFFSLKPGPDGHAPSVAGLPDGFPIDQDGHRYLKRTVGFGGSGAMFQQVS